MTLYQYCMEQKRFDLLQQWHPTKNELTPDEISYGSNKKIWWLCEKGHEWQAAVSARVHGAGCPVCANRRVQAGVNDLATTNPTLAGQWHPEKNGDLTPRDVFEGTERKVWWRCEKGHEWQATVHARSIRGIGCPVCAGKTIVAGVNDLATFSPEIAAQWHPEKNGSHSAQEVSPYSNRKVWWLCDKGHEYQAIISSHTARGMGCPYCAGQKVLAGFNDLATVDPKTASQWHKELNGALTPQMVTRGSKKKIWWQCDEGHVWKTAVHIRTGPAKSGCPVCSGKKINTSGSDQSVFCDKKYDGENGSHD